MDEWISKIVDQYGLWPVIAFPAGFLGLVTGHQLVAFLLLLSGVIALRSLTGMFDRYGVKPMMARRVATCAAVVSLLLFAALPEREGAASAGEQSGAPVVDQSEAPDVHETVETYDDSAASAYCEAIDGDTLRCGDERVRLAGIDAPEMPGHCRAGRQCAPGDPFASLASLASMLDGEVRINRMGLDQYGRTIAHVYFNGMSLACAQLRGGHAIYVKQWDEDFQLSSDCAVKMG